MRNSEFFKSTNTNSQTHCNSEEPLYSENCTLQLAPIAPKEETTETLNWSTFLMRRLILMNSSFLIHSSAASRKVRPLPITNPSWAGTPPLAPLSPQKDLGRFARADPFR